MDKLLKIGTGILAVLTVVACLSTVCIFGYALVGGESGKSSEEVYQAEIQAHNEETQDIHVLNESTPAPLENPTLLYDEHIHNYTDSVDVKADCYQEGRLKYTCDTCGDVYYIDMPMTEHRADDEWTVTREATPDLVGLRVKYCIYCDQIVAIEDIPYTLEENSTSNEIHIHNYTSTTEKEPTCVFAGLRKYICSCGDFYTEPIHAMGHIASDWEVAAEATATHKGTEQRMCRVCGVLLDLRPIDAKRESSSSAESSANTATPTITPTNTLMPTSIPTQRPTVAPSPVNTPRPTVTPSPVNTPRPTVTPTVRPTTKPTNIPTTRPTSTPNERIYGLGDTWTVEGQWNLTITGVSETQERNSWSDKNPASVYVIDYTYENIGYDNPYDDGIFFFLNTQTIVDNMGKTGYGYTVESILSDQPKSAPIGAYCDAKDSIAVDNSGEFKIYVTKYDGNEIKRSATFVLPISGEVEKPTPTATAKPTIAPTPTPAAATTPTPTPPIQSINYSIGEMTFYTYDDNSYYRFIQPITNTGNVPLYLKNCTLDIEDENGHLLSTESFISNCPDVISPGETGYFYNGLGSLSTNDAVKNASSIVAVPKLEIVESDEEPIAYRIWDTSFTQGNFSPSVVGRITNNTREDDSLVYVQAIFYGENGNVIHITGTNIINLPAGQTQSFEILILPTSGENISYENIANYEVIARKAHYQF